MEDSSDSPALPVIDVAPLVEGAPGAACSRVASQIQAACRERGFFYVTGHDVPAGLLGRLEAASAEFFALPLEDKLEIAMERGGRAWRGFFPVGAELTSGQPDLKEGLYFGAELADTDPRVRAGVPLHGRNLFPRQVPELRPLVLSYLDAMTGLGQAVLRGVALSLGLEAGYFAAGYTADPTILFRIFSYPAPPPQADGWGVGDTPTTGCSRCSPRTATAACRSPRRKAGPTRRRSPEPSSATSATCWSASPAAGTAPRRTGSVTSAAAAGSRSRSSSIPASPPRYLRCRGGPRPVRTGGRGGTARTCGPSAAATATTCWARYRRSFAAAA